MTNRPPRRPDPERPTPPPEPSPFDLPRPRPKPRPRPTQPARPSPEGWPDGYPQQAPNRGTGTRPLQPGRPQPGSPASSPPPYPQQPGGYPPGYQPGYPPQYEAPPPRGPAYAPPRRRHGIHLPRPRGCGCGCLPTLFVLGIVALVMGIYLMFPGRTNVLLMGIDYTPPGSSAGRSDTLILTTFQPHRPYLGMLSIPRDLWVTIPGYGENRINTAHFFAEATQVGAGPSAALQTVESNFGVNVGYYVRIRFEGFREVFNAMGGVDIYLEEPAAGYEAGQHHLSGNKALAFARHRSGEDDFFRMEHGQFILKSAFKQMLNPLKWWRIPGILVASGQAIDTNIPVYLWPRLGFTLLRLGPDGIDNRTVRREMVTNTITAEGAQVLVPDWNQINPVLMEMFGQ